MTIVLARLRDGDPRSHALCLSNERMSKLNAAIQLRLDYACAGGIGLFLTVSVEARLGRKSSKPAVSSDDTPFSMA